MDNRKRQMIGGKPKILPDIPSPGTAYRCKICKRVFMNKPDIVKHLTLTDSTGRRIFCEPEPDVKIEAEKKPVVNNKVNNNVKVEDRKPKNMILQDSNAEETGPTNTVQSDEGGNLQIPEKKALQSVSGAKETVSPFLKPATPLCSNATKTTPAKLKPATVVNNHSSTAVSNDMSSVTSMNSLKNSTDIAQTKTKASVAPTATSVVADMEPPNSNAEVPEIGAPIVKRRETAVRSTSRRKSSSVITEASSETERVPLTRRQSSKTKESEEAKPETKATAKNQDNSAHLENKSDVKLNGVERVEEQNTNHLPEAMETGTDVVTDDLEAKALARQAQYKLSRLQRIANSTKPNKIKSLQKKIYHCRHCEETFAFPIHVQVHMRKVHKKSESKITSTDASPVKTESPNQYPLRSLSIRCKRKASISMRRNEENEKPRKKPTKFTCRHCSKKFNYLSQLKIHQGKVHPEVTNGEIKIETQGIPKKRKVRRSRLTLKKRLFRKLVPVTQSLPEEQSTAPSESNGTNVFDIPPLVNNREKPTRKRKRYVKFSCRHCFKQFPLLNDLRRHHQTDHPDLAKQRKAKPEVMEKVDPFPVPSIPSMPKSEEPDDENNEPTAEEKEALDALMKAYDDNESEGIIETPDSILYGLRSELSRTCPNCMKVFKFSGNLKNHWKVCGSAVKMEIDSDDDHDEEMEENSNNDGEDETNENELNAGGGYEHEGDELKAPFYEQLDFRRCWICDVVVSRFHNLKRHLLNIHQIDMTYGDIRKKQSRLLKSEKM